MILNIIRLVIVIIGFGAAIILFYRFPKLKSKENIPINHIKLSIIIPVRNEEKNIALLLGDLQKQEFTIHEIICVDDASEDKTKEIVKGFGITLIELKDKPQGWLGKSWACASGARVATGDTLLFLDADVRLKENAISKLLGTYQEQQCVISVQPYHTTYKFYEQFSLFFNVVQIAGNGSALPKPQNIGIYGPVIMLSQTDYQKIGGHESVKSCIVEDMALAKQMTQKQVLYRVYIGDESISFRMYSGGLRSLFQGWIKNLAIGVTKTPLKIGLPVFFLFGSLSSVPLQITRFSILQNNNWIIVYSIFYIIWVVALLVITRNIGKFKKWMILLYPILLLVFLGVFIVSLIKKIFKMKVIWKGRAIKTEEKQ